MTGSRKLAVALAGVVAVATVLLVQRRRPERPPSVDSPAATRPTPAPANPHVGAEKAGSSGGVVPTDSLPPQRGWPIDDGFRARIGQAIATGDKLHWMPAVTDLLNPIYDRDQATSLLAGLLAHPNWEIRTYAADLLLQMGSKAGVPVLQAAVRAASEGREISELAVATAATRLHAYRQPINARELMLAYDRLKTPELLNVLVMQQVPDLVDMARARWAQHIEGFQSLRLAPFAGLKDEEALAHYRRALGGEPRTQVIARWALYQATGDEQHLDQLVAWAREASGLAPRTEASWRMLEGEILDLLTITAGPKTAQALRAISDESAAKSGNQATFGRAFTALFYLHRDYAFVDQRLMAFFRGEYQGAGVDRGLMMRIAAARGTPELEAAARRFNPAAYEREFIQQRQRPVEQWVNLINVPVSVAPPLDKSAGAPPGR